MIPARDKRHEKRLALGFDQSRAGDNVFSHWLLRLHRAVPGWALQVEIALAVLGAVMIGLGVRREARARRGSEARGRP